MLPQCWGAWRDRQSRWCRDVDGLDGVFEGDALGDCECGDEGRDLPGGHVGLREGKKKKFTMYVEEH